MRNRDYVSAVSVSSPTRANSLSGSSMPRLDMARRRLWMPERTSVSLVLDQTATILGQDRAPEDSGVGGAEVQTLVLLQHFENHAPSPFVD